MKRVLAGLCGLLMTALLASVALGHDQPSLRVDPAIAAAGGTLKVVGADMEVASRWRITLERLGRATTLRDSVVATGDDEGGFTVTLTIPADTTPGSYVVRATTTDGKSASADLTVTDQASAARSGPATMRMASGEDHVLDRTKPVVEVASLLVIAALAAAAGGFLVQGRERD